MVLGFLKIENQKKITALFGALGRLSIYVVVCSLKPFVTERWSPESHSCVLAVFSNQIVAGGALGAHSPEHEKATTN